MKTSYFIMKALINEAIDFKANEQTFFVACQLLGEFYWVLEQEVQI